MAAGQYLSERTVHEIERGRHTDNSVIGAVIMLFSYLLGGAIPSLPIFLFPFPYASLWVLTLSFIGLFTLGYIKGKIVNISPKRSAIEMLVIGGIATLIGAVAGYFLKS
jgi:predicted membrane protein (TIGR00267 family)